MLTLTLYNPNTSTWIDVSDLVESTNDVPILETNNYKEMVASIYQCKINSTVDSTLIISATEAMVSDLAGGIFRGVIKKRLYDVGNKCWNLEIYSLLIRLDDYKLVYDQFNSILSNTANRGNYGTDSTGFYSCNVVWLMEAMMQKAGIPYNISSLYDKVNSNFVGTFSGYNHYLVDMRIDVAMLWCLNQQYATTRDRLDNGLIEGYDAKQYTLSLYQLMQALTGLFNITIRYELGGYFFYRKQNMAGLDEYSISQDSTYEYSEDEQKDIINLISTSQKTRLLRSCFNNYTQDYDLNHTDSYLGANGNSTKQFINNLYFLVRYGGGADNLWDVWVSLFDYHISCISYPLSSNYSRQNPFLSQEKKKTWVTDYRSTGLNVMKHSVDVRQQNSIIEQGWY